MFRISLDSGKLVFLETGRPDAGLAYIMSHAGQFADVGIRSEQIPSAVMTTVTQGKVVGYKGKGFERPIYECVFNDTRHRMLVLIGDNGFIVGANPQGRLKPY